MTETAVLQKFVHRRWYYAAFFVFGMLAGVGVTAAIVVPPINEALHQAQTTISQQRQVINLKPPCYASQ
jgi:hypothetical protein